LLDIGHIIKLKNNKVGLEKAMIKGDRLKGTGYFNTLLAKNQGVL
jgi:hypothetical protein